jgi:hypothetical protein
MFFSSKLYSHPNNLKYQRLRKFFLSLKFNVNNPLPKWQLEWLPIKQELQILQVELQLSWLEEIEFQSFLKAI